MSWRRAYPRPFRVVNSTRLPRGEEITRLVQHDSLGGRERGLGGEERVEVVFWIEVGDRPGGDEQHEHEVTQRGESHAVVETLELHLVAQRAKGRGVFVVVIRESSHAREEVAQRRPVLGGAVLGQEVATGSENP